MRLKLLRGALAATVLIVAVVISSIARDRNTDAKHQASWTEEEFDKLFKANNNWGRWGKDDQLGAINLITDAKRKQAASLVKAGISVSVAHDLLKEDAVDNPTSFKQTMGASFRTDTFLLKNHGYNPTHIDALCHFTYPYHGLLYNGIPGTSSNENGCSVLSIEALKDGILTRGILIDIPRFRSVPYLEPGTRVYPDEVEAWLKKIGVKPSPGDAIILRTGRWSRRDKLGPWNPAGNAAGFDVSMLPWFKANDIALVGSDVLPEALTTPPYIQGQTTPPPDFHAEPLHAGLVDGLGIPVMDDLDAESLSETASKLNRWEFMFVVEPLRAPGGTGSPINPMAVF